MGATLRAETGTRRRRGLAVLVAVLAPLGLAAYGSPSSVSAAPTPSLDVLPKGAQIVHPVPPPPPGNTCTASLPPPTPMPTPGQMPKNSYLEQIQARGYLKVGVAQDTYLWSYRDPATDDQIGFDIDMLRQVAVAIFGSSDPSHIKFVIVPNADRAEAVRKDQVDLLAETMTINCARETGKEAVDFSTVYYLAHQKILVPSTSAITGSQDLGGKRVCAPAGSTSLQNLVAAGMPRNIQLWAVADPTECLVMLQQGQVDAISTDDAILLGLQAQDHLNTKIVGNPISAEPYGIAISQSHPGLTSFVNGVLAQVEADGTWTQTYDKYLQPSIGGAAPAPPTPSYR